MTTNDRSQSTKPGWALIGLLFLTTIFAGQLSAQPSTPKSAWPQDYTVRRDDVAGKLILSTPYYTIQHDLKKGGAIEKISLTNGRAPSLILSPMESTIRLKMEASAIPANPPAPAVKPQAQPAGAPAPATPGQRGGGRAQDTFSDLNCATPTVVQAKDGKSVIVTVEVPLLDRAGKASGVALKTVYTYRWGYIKIHKEFRAIKDPVKVRSVSVLSTLVDPSLTDYGWRPAVFEEMGPSPHTWQNGQIRQWGKIRPGTHFDLPFQTRYVPRYVVLANPGIEGLEWFMADDLSQYDYQVTGTPGTGYCEFRPSVNPLGIAVTINPLHLSPSFDLPQGGWVPLQGTWTFDSFIGIPILEGHANRPWLNQSYRVNKGGWVTEEEIKKNAENGVVTMHLHNDGDANRDGLFWRDGSYPPYPPAEMKKMDAVIDTIHKYGMKTAPYFSNHEFHPSNEVFWQKSEEWGRKPDDQGNLRPNFVYGAHMCLKSGWLEYFKYTVDRVLKNHKFDGVYYDWNIALYCNNPLHVGKTTTGVRPDRGLGAFALSPTGHWDIEGLLDVVEWTRERVGPDGLVILHNTLVPMFATENFASYVVGMEFTYGTIKTGMPRPEELPLEWNFVGARPRAVIGYGTIARDADKRMYQLHAITTLMTSVAPWPASEEAIALYKILKPLGDIEQYRFEDGRNKSVKLDDRDCLTAIYGKAGEAYLLLANVDPIPKKIRVRIDPKKLPVPLAAIASAEILGKGAASLQAANLTGGGEEIMIPADDVVLVRIK